GGAAHQLNQRMREQLAGVVDHDALAPGSLPRVDAEDHPTPERRREEELREVLREDLHGLDIRGLLQIGAHVRLDRRHEQTLRSIDERILELARERRSAAPPDAARDLERERILVDAD